MKKEKKLVVCSFLLLCVGILLFTGFKAKNHTEEYRRGFNGVYFINDEEHKFNEATKVLDTVVTIEAEDNQLVVKLPEYSRHEKWAIDSDVYLNYVVVETTEMINNMYFTEYRIKIDDYNLDSISFKRIVHDGNFDDMNYSYLMNIEIDYRNITSLKNAFYHELIEIGNFVYYPAKDEKDGYIEMRVIKKSDEISRSTEYSQKYLLDITLHYKNGYEHSQRKINIENMFLSYDVNKEVMLIESLPDYKKSQEIEDCVKKGEASIEIQLVSIQNETEKYMKNSEITIAK